MYARNKLNHSGFGAPNDYVTVTIANGETESDVVPLNGNSITGFIFGDVGLAGTLTAKVSMSKDPTTFVALSSWTGLTITDDDAQGIGATDIYNWPFVIFVVDTDPGADIEFAALIKGL